MHIEHGQRDQPVSFDSPQCAFIEENDPKQHQPELRKFIHTDTNAYTKGKPH